jgi:hypothetical protein
MPWPDSLAALLARPDSRASQALRWSLHGLRGSLRAALDEAAADPGGEELRGLLAELDSLLDRGSIPPDSVLPSESAPALPVTPAEPDFPPGSPRLLPLARAVAADSRFRPDLERSPLRQGSDEEIWNDVQRLLLRAPPRLAEEWRQRSLQLAAKAGGRPDETRAAVVPLGRDEAIYPGLTGDVDAKGLRSTSDAPLDPRVAAPADSGLRFLAGVVSTYLWFIENDPHLGHCLKTVFRFGITPLGEDQRQRYLEELVKLWKRVVAGAAEPPTSPLRHWAKNRIRERLDLDEALHSLVYQPPAAGDSWWGRLQGQARDTLFAARDRSVQAGCPVHLQVLGGNFAEINRLAPDSLQVDFGVPGEVAACLRVWARVDGDEIKGRVLYRSPQEEA